MWNDCIWLVILYCHGALFHCCIGAFKNRMSTFSTTACLVCSVIELEVLHLSLSCPALWHDPVERRSWALLVLSFLPSVFVQHSEDNVAGPSYISTCHAPSCPRSKCLHRTLHIQKSRSVKLSSSVLTFTSFSSTCCSDFTSSPTLLLFTPLFLLQPVSVSSLVAWAPEECLYLWGDSCYRFGDNKTSVELVVECWSTYIKIESKSSYFPADAYEILNLLL